MKVFLIGATGYVGSHVGARLIAAGHEVMGFARNEAGAAKVRALGAAAQIGDLSDLAALTRDALGADATIFAAQLMQEEEYATVSALLEAYKKTGKTFIFTSGTGVLSQRTYGEWTDETFAEDDEFIPNKYLQRRRHTEIMTRAASQDGVRAMVIRPPMIWGHGRFGVAEGVRASVNKTGQACYLGKGLNIYTNVHVDDLAELYLLALEKGVAGALYHAAGGELNYRMIAECVARMAGVETRSVTPEEGFELWGSFSVIVAHGASSRSRSPRSRRELGWRPQKTDLASELLGGALEGREPRTGSSAARR